MLRSAEAALAEVDLPTQALVLEILAGLRDTGKTIVFATHDLAMASESSDLCVLLNRRVIAAGPPRDVLNVTNLQATYGGAAILPSTLDRKS